MRKVTLPFRARRDGGAPGARWPGGDDIRLHVLRCAIRAPSPRNSQPWKVALRGSGRIVLSIDHSRAARALDPLGRQVFISCGAFIENLDISAREFGYRADIDLFPAGWPDPGKPLQDPVANIDLEKEEGIQPDPLFPSIPLRSTNRRPYAKRPVPLPVAGELADAGDCERVPLGFTSDRNLIREIGGLAMESLALELSDRERLLESIEYFRFTDAEAAGRRDGYGLAQSGYGKVARLIAGAFRPSRDSALSRPEVFSRRAVSDLSRAVEKCGGFGWLSTKGDFRIDQVRTGRAFERIHLKATSLSLAVQPVTQPIADYKEMTDIKTRLYELLAVPETHTLQMLFRTGYAGPVPPTPRRGVPEFIVP